LSNKYRFKAHLRDHAERTAEALDEDDEALVVRLLSRQELQHQTIALRDVFYLLEELRGYSAYLYASKENLS
jgi:hypothetical protein